MHDLVLFWGKTPKTGEAADRYHPAIYHMLDVAFVAEALLRDGTPRLRRALLHAWQGCNPEALLAWLPFLIATHDLGKISAAFQGQVQPQRERLERAGVHFASGATKLYHAEISAVWLHGELARREPAAPTQLVWALRDAMGGHHGRFAQAGMSDIRKRLVFSERGEPRWVFWRGEAYILLRQMLGPSIPITVVGEPRHLRAATAALTGLIVWCDWMGSNECDFPAVPDLGLEQYCVLGRECATQALELHHLRVTRPAPTYAGYDALFSEPPRPLQALIDQLPESALHGPLLAVIEAPTGEGKTEAALLLARRIAALSAVDEIFFALPTMATSNQMYARLSAFYSPVRLTHSQSVAVEPDLRRQVALAGDTTNEASPSADAALEWFAGSKKAMLAPFGVGTVDQIELAGLNVRHYPLRLFGLAGKVVVIDEIHAYDAYMSAILVHTLTWLARLGCSVILLSATLPAIRHGAMAEAFLRGLGDQAAAELGAAPAYPSLALYRAGSQLHEIYAVFRGEQCFTLRLRAQRSPADEARHLLDLVRDGGAVARLCNRVDDAQALYQALMSQLPTDSRVLLHARFPLDLRLDRERQITRMVGKNTNRDASQPLIIVGTQVLEQSLDYDVDVMVSDFAPIDLLLQRAGRLHRHDRASKRPPRHAVPILEVTLPLDTEQSPVWERWKAIYEPYVLWRTWQVLRERLHGAECEIVLPRDYRPLIEAVYADWTNAPDDAHAAAIARAKAAYERLTDERESLARRPLTPDVLSLDAIIENGGRDFIDDETSQAASWQLAKTRLGDSISVVPVYRVNGSLALDTPGTFTLSADLAPPLDSPYGASQKDILMRAIPISDRRIIAAYRDERRQRELRWPWVNIPALLRSVHPLPLDASHTAILPDGRRVRLDTELGLVIEKEEL